MLWQYSFQDFLEVLIIQAKQSTCTRSKCGSIIVKDGEIIGTWYNSPPRNNQSQRRCSYEKGWYHNKVTDKTCCIHAEQRAIFDALISNSQKIVGSRLYFVRLNENNLPKLSWKPYCTICSKSALDVWIWEFALYTGDTFTIYDTDEYNKLSFLYNE